MTEREGESLRRLKVDMIELETAFDADPTWGSNHYLDLETGKVIMISEEARDELESIYEEFDVEDPSFNLADVIQTRDLPDWEKEVVLEADQVEEGFGDRYIRVPYQDSHEAYRDMQSFIETVQNPRLQNALWQAIGGRKPFRSFKDVLFGYPHERERWFEFSNQCLRERILAWLESEGIDPIFESSQDAAE